MFRNKVSGDLLSLATYPPEGLPKRDLIYQTDTAHECFPSGLPAWNRPKDDPHQGAELTTLDCDVTPLRIPDSRNTTSVRVEVLKYCFISELKGRKNVMAQGYCWSGEKAVVFVQHTSATPITTEFVTKMTRALIQRQGGLEVSETHN